jgi:hypothetical protein
VTHPHAEVALHAARNFRRWGRYAAVRYCLKRGVPLQLLCLALLLEQGKL